MSFPKDFLAFSAPRLSQFKCPHEGATFPSRDLQAEGFDGVSMFLTSLNIYEKARVSLYTGKSDFQHLVEIYYFHSTLPEIDFCRVETLTLLLPAKYG